MKENNSNETTNAMIPDSVLYRPGEEPDKLRSRLETLFGKLDSSYPDKVIISLDKKHKKWAETVVKLYRELGYPDRTSFLNAYGYSVKTKPKGRPKANMDDFIEELKNRYDKGATCSTYTELQNQNPDLNTQFNTFRYKSNELYGMSAVEFLTKEGIIAKSTTVISDKDLVKLKERYNERSFFGKLSELRRDNQDVNFRNIEKLIKQQNLDMNLQSFLEKEQVLMDAKMRIELLKERYINTENNKKPNNFRVLRSENMDVDFSGIKEWIIEEEKADIDEFLREAKLIKTTLSDKLATMSDEEKLNEITSILQERASLNRGGTFRSYEKLKQKCKDLPFDQVDSWIKAIGEENPEDYFKEKGILAESYGEKIQREKRKIIAKALREGVEPVYYDPPVYFVEEVELWGEEAKEWEVSDDLESWEEGLYIKDYLGNQDRVVVPISLNGQKVTGLAVASFQHCQAKTIEIPGYFKEIPDKTGLNNSYLEKVRIGEGVEKIGEQCFKNNENLRTVEVSQSVVHIDSVPFYYNGPNASNHWYTQQSEYIMAGSVLLKYVGDEIVLNVPHGIKTIASSVSDTDFVMVILPKTVTTLSHGAFASSYRKNIEEFVFTDSLVNIGSNAFGQHVWHEKFKNQKHVIFNGIYYRHNGEDANVIIPEGVTQIGVEAFIKSIIFKNREPISVTFPQTLQVIRLSAFANCRSLRNVVFNEGLIEIEKYAFERCIAIKEVVFPKTLLKIGESSFQACSSLKEIQFSESIEIIGESAFGGCSSLEEVVLNKGLKRLEAFAFAGCSSLKSIDVPPNFEKIERRTFANCTSLEEMKIPEGVRSLEEGSFHNCTSLIKIVLPSSIQKFGDRAFEGTALDQITLPEKIGAYCFKGCHNLRTIQFHEEMKEIPEGAFENCLSIEELTIPEGISYIGDGAFLGCKTLKKVIIPSTVKEIGERAFANCDSLEEVVFLGEMPEQSINTFANTPYLRKSSGDFIIDKGILIQYIGTNLHVEVPEGVKIIAENSFKEAKFVESISMSDSVMTISDNIFGYGDSLKIHEPSLKKLKIGSNVESIGVRAFCHCTELEEVVFSPALTKIAKKAFFGCNKLKTVDLSGTLVKVIENEAFCECTSLATLHLSNEIEYIGEQSFYDADLKTVKVPKTAKRIGLGAFYSSKNSYPNLIIYDSFEPDAVEASEWEYDKERRVNSILPYALLGMKSIYGSFTEYFTVIWKHHYITVLSSETEEIKYVVYVDGNERMEYKNLVLSAWGKHASFKFSEYDDYFTRSISIAGRAEMAFCRIMYPYELSEEHRKNYEIYLERCMYIEKSARSISEVIARNDRVEYLEILMNYNSINDRNKEWIMETFLNMEPDFQPKKSIAYMREKFSL